MSRSPDPLPPGAIAVIFVSRRNDADAAGYAAASAAMAAEAALQPGYLGMDAVRDADGAGITVSYWASDADAVRWRAHAGHSAVRALGRSRWYSQWRVVVAAVTRGYASGPPDR